MSNGKRLKRNYFHSGDGDVQEISKRFKKGSNGSSPKASRITREDDRFDWKQEVAKIKLVEEPKDFDRDNIGDEDNGVNVIENL